LQPEIHIFGLTLQTFGLAFAFGFIAAGAVIGKRLTELGKPPDWAYEIVFAALIGGLIGSRLDFLIENYSDVKDDLLGSIFSGSGLVWYGGAIGGALGVSAWARWRGMLNWALTDLCAPSLALGYAIGRIGCQLSGDGDYGKAWSGPWAMAYPNGTSPTGYGGSAIASRPGSCSPSISSARASSGSWSSSSDETTTPLWA
jgi:phosphatidylglycerol:prolipoprotein diacylglycerol transferase